eukprot:6212248-Pleurochrysis_carterae.AAC.3
MQGRDQTGSDCESIRATVLFDYSDGNASFRGTAAIINVVLHRAHSAYRIGMHNGPKGARAGMQLVDEGLQLQPFTPGTSSRPVRCKCGHPLHCTGSWWAEVEADGRHAIEVCAGRMPSLSMLWLAVPAYLCAARPHLVNW